MLQICEKLYLVESINATVICPDHRKRNILMDTIQKSTYNYWDALGDILFFLPYWISALWSCWEKSKHFTYKLEENLIVGLHNGPYLLWWHLKRPIKVHPICHILCNDMSLLAFITCEIHSRHDHVQFSHNSIKNRSKTISVSVSKLNLQKWF